MTGWRDLAACRRDPDMWFTPSLRAAAVHVCRKHCPVAEDCYRALRSTSITSGVMAGVAFADDGAAMTKWGVGKSVSVCTPDCRPFRRTTGEGEG